MFGNCRSLFEAPLINANLINASLISANLINAKLSSAKLFSAILLSTDFRESKNLTRDQLEGAYQPLICNSSLPQDIKIDPSRDCDKVAAALYKRYPEEFSSLEEAEEYVKEQREKKWD